jgi:4-aminobutyrate aminotransferase-like enzyme
MKNIFFNTYSAGHMQCKIGLEVLNIIKKEKLNENAEKVGNFLLA